MSGQIMVWYGVTCYDVVWHGMCDMIFGPEVQAQTESSRPDRQFSSSTTPRLRHKIRVFLGPALERIAQVGATAYENK